ncbi:ABC transporter substrate-binding protein [Limnofasciculus baicalensis]|uniref:ABC transporter substrate-binding protein n=1 Tax=Limnofasciculus baicalensis BBK-W-15 TaxID=2699891 RepID=A0AAE3GS52_9CYAN|nr:ABC transporter substrate-binding protein [Limnofasciculus baicalensis]MCP2728838.1 ABC transporter substrate-binding protein [Limnofasciculus baicalensis BBK-W-15]
MKIRKLLSLLIIFVFGLAIAVSCTPSQPTSNYASTTPAKTSPIQMGFSAWPGWLPWQVAQEEKLFAANKVKVDLKWFDGYLDSINALAAGQLDANTQTLNDTISSIAAGAEQVIVLVNDNSTGNDKIIVRDGIKTIGDLKGKRIGVEVGTVDHFLLLLGLKKAGLSATDVQIQPLETGIAAAAFVAGQIDAAAVFAPFTTKALQRPGSKELFSSKDFPGAIPDHLVVTRKMIEERPQDVQALVNTWFDTLDFMKKNPEKSLSILSKRAGVSVQEYKQYDAGTKIFTIQDNLKAFSPGKDMHSLSYAAQEVSKFLVELKLIKTAPDLTKLFDDRFVKTYSQN